MMDLLLVNHLKNREVLTPNLDTVVHNIDLVGTGHPPQKR